MAVIGIDLGGTKITGAVFDDDGNMLGRVSRLLEGRAGSEVGALVLSVIDRLGALHGAAGIRSVGVCVPGIADSKTGRTWAPNIAGWDDYPLRREIEEHPGVAASAFPAGVRVDIASDRTCYILGETWKGAARGCSDALFVAVGTGIGVGIMIDGRILHGHGDVVGAAGWMALESLWQDEYEKYGCFEGNASGNGIALQTRKIIHDGTLFPESMLRGGEAASITARDVFAAYEQRDPLAVHVLGRAVKMWGMAAANLVSLLNPEKIVWGGGVFGPAVRFLDDIYEEACRWAQPLSIRQAAFEASQLSGDAGLYGAGHLAILALKNGDAYV
jgi:glucokinase